MKNRIPKVIHYCWFGGNPLTEDAKKCIESWKKHCPGYKIIEWNESNYDVNKNLYTRETYRQKQWAFLTDYVRLDVIFLHGGIYLDTDVEIVRPFNELLSNSCFMGMEQPGRVATGLGFGAIAKHSFVRVNKSFYEKETNIVDKTGKLKKNTCVTITSELLKKRGLAEKNTIQEVGDVVVFPTEYFCPKKLGTNKLTVTNNTYSIHHYDASWKSKHKIIRKAKYYAIPITSKLKKMLCGKK